VFKLTLEDSPRCNTFQSTTPKYQGLDQERRQPGISKNKAVSNYVESECLANNGSWNFLGTVQISVVSELTEYRSLPTATTLCSVDLQVIAAAHNNNPNLYTMYMYFLEIN
jgi:hypothetical protein